MSWRICRPEDTTKRFRHILPAAGISRIADLTALDRLGIPVHIAIRPNSRTYSVQTGKGETVEASVASAMMEAIEVFHSETLAQAPLLETHQNLSGWSDVLSAKFLFRRSGGKFSEQKAIEWISAISLRSGKEVFVPVELVCTDFSLRKYRRDAGVVPSSTGLASGNTLEEAIFHAICEIIERDSLTIWTLSGKSNKYCRSIDIASIHDQKITEIIDNVYRCGSNIDIFEVINEFNIAVVYAEIIDSDYSEAGNVLRAGGAGCHLSREIAIARAIAEAAQSRITAISGVRDNISSSYYEALISRAAGDLPITMRGTHLHEYINIPNHQFANASDGIAFLLSVLGNMEVLLVDLTRREFMVPVVRVIIPSLEDGLDIPGYIPGLRVLLRTVGELGSETIS